MINTARIISYLCSLLLSSTLGVGLVSLALYDVLPPYATVLALLVGIPSVMIGSGLILLAGLYLIVYFAENL